MDAVILAVAGLDLNQLLNTVLGAVIAGLIGRRAARRGVA